MLKWIPLGQLRISPFFNRSMCGKIKPHYANVSTHCWRTHTCGELRHSHVGKRVTLCGWAEFCRGRFVILRDWQGQVQVMLKNGNVNDIRTESVLKVHGIVEMRPEKDTKPELESGDIEVHVDKIEVLNPCKALPFSIQEFAEKGEEVRMRYRYLDIRSREMQKHLRARSKLISAMRQYLIDKHGFVEVETPTLFRPTPGGAKEFLVPSSVDRGLFYSLPQSPQQFKQLLMVGGIDRYFQVARCYRDEGAKPDRQPEFTQLDIEMSFVSAKDVMNITESMIKRCWPSDLTDLPFPKMTYDKALKKYGTDKPDLRINLHITNLSNLLDHPSNISGVVIPKKYLKYFSKDVTDKMHAQLVNLCSEKHSRNGLYVFNTGNVNHISGDRLDNYEVMSDMQVCGDGNILWISWSDSDHDKTTLGKAIHILADTIEECGSSIKDDSFKFLWVYDFPLFETNDDETLSCVHHPFTAPHPDDIQLLSSDPTKVRSLAYDLVLNGSEVAGGSIRIHSSLFQRTILKDYLNIDTTDLEHLLNALDCGAPPHGGIAIGLDRLLSMLCGTNTIRDVIAFPKSSLGRDLMCGAPCQPNEQLFNHFFKSTKS